MKEDSSIKIGRDCSLRDEQDRRWTALRAQLRVGSKPNMCFLHFIFCVFLFFLSCKTVIVV